MQVVEIEKKSLLSTLETHKNAGFSVLMDLTATDYVTHTEILYFLHNPTSYERLLVKTKVARGETISTVISLWEGANWYERELWDMFGVEVTGHPDLTRILMPDEWIGHPMRKDYPLTEEPVAFKHNVHPKIPSEIIPYVK